MAAFTSSFITWAIFSAAHYFSVIPRYVARTMWIGNKTGEGNKMTLGAIAATGGVNVIDLARSLDVIIKPSPACGVCGNETGQYEEEGQARYFDREGANPPPFLRDFGVASFRPYRPYFKAHPTPLSP